MPSTSFTGAADVGNLTETMLGGEGLLEGRAEGRFEMEIL